MITKLIDFTDEYNEKTDEICREGITVLMTLLGLCGT